MSPWVYRRCPSHGLAAPHEWTREETRKGIAVKAWVTAYQGDETAACDVDALSPEGDFVTLARSTLAGATSVRAGRDMADAWIAAQLERLAAEEGA